MRTFVSENKVDAYNFAKAAPIRMPCIILVNPFSDANVGSVSRAMLNFGLHELRIVDPQCDILSNTATTLAVGSLEVLRNAKIFHSLEECISDLDVIVATTARKKRTVNQHLMTPYAAASEIINRNDFTGVACSAGIVFGRERDGLTNKEMALANRRVAISTFEHYEVLNLAQAVNIMAYECWKRKLYVSEGQCDDGQLVDEKDTIDKHTDIKANGTREQLEQTFTGASATVSSVDFSTSPSMLQDDTATSHPSKPVTTRSKEGKSQLATSEDLNFFFDRMIQIMESKYRPMYELKLAQNKLPQVASSHSHGIGKSNNTSSIVETHYSKEDLTKESFVEGSIAGVNTGAGAMKSLTPSGFLEKDLTSMKTIFRRASINQGELQLLHGILSSISK